MIITIKNSELEKNHNSNKKTEEEAPKDQIKKSSDVSTLDKFRTIIHDRGGRGIIGLARQFKIFDDNNSKTLEYNEFAKAIKDLKVDLSESEIKSLFAIFDRDGRARSTTTSSFVKFAAR